MPANSIQNHLLKRFQNKAHMHCTLKVDFNEKINMPNDDDVYDNRRKSGEAVL